MKIQGFSQPPAAKQRLVFYHIWGVLSTKKVGGWHQVDAL